MFVFKKNKKIVVFHHGKLKAKGCIINYDNIISNFTAGNMSLLC